MYDMPYLPYSMNDPYRNQYGSSFEPVYIHGHPAQSSYGSDDERFFPFFLPFIAGLAIGPLLFNRPCCPPYFPPYPPPYPPPAMPFYQQPPGGIAGSFNQVQQGNTPVYGGITENVNIYTK